MRGPLADDAWMEERLSSFLVDELFEVVVVRIQKLLPLLLIFRYPLLHSRPHIRSTWVCLHRMGSLFEFLVVNVVIMIDLDELRVSSAFIKYLAHYSPLTLSFLTIIFVDTRVTLKLLNLFQ